MLPSVIIIVFGAKRVYKFPCDNVKKVIRPMAKRHACEQCSHRQISPTRRASVNLDQWNTLISKHITTALSFLSSNSFIVLTTTLIIFFTFLLPDFSERIDKSTELKEMKKVLDKITDEITQAEKACFTAAEELCNLHYVLQDGADEPIPNNKLVEIGSAYDTLHRDVKEIVKIEHCKSCCQHQHQDLDRRKKHDLNVVAMLNKKNVCTGLQTRENTAFNEYCLTKNASTLTRYPLKSTGAGIATRKVRIYKEECTCRNSDRRSWNV
ncbi:unnamed protein product [Leptosia nina]|uniref:Bursicon n=1 Tax=Leptosia nina TaxID=320188 RepID=A0AAV1JF92_9NEOP